MADGLQATPQTPPLPPAAPAIEAQPSPQADPITSLVNDPEFAGLSPAAKRMTLSAHDPEFKDISDAGILSYVSAHKAAANAPNLTINDPDFKNLPPEIKSQMRQAQAAQYAKEHPESSDYFAKQFAGATIAPHKDIRLSDKNQLTEFLDIMRGKTPSPERQKEMKERFNRAYQSSVLAYGLRNLHGIGDTTYRGERGESGEVEKIFGSPEQLADPGTRLRGALKVAGDFSTISNATLGAALAASGGFLGPIAPLTTKVLTTLTGAGFTAQMAAGLYRTHKEYREAVDSGDLDKARELQGSMMAQGGATGLAAFGTYKAGATPSAKYRGTPSALDEASSRKALDVTLPHHERAFNQIHPENASAGLRGEESALPALRNEAAKTGKLDLTYDAEGVKKVIGSAGSAIDSHEAVIEPIKNANSAASHNGAKAAAAARGYITQEMTDAAASGDKGVASTIESINAIAKRAEKADTISKADSLRHDWNDELSPEYNKPEAKQDVSPKVRQALKAAVAGLRDSEYGRLSELSGQDLTPLAKKEGILIEAKGALTKTGKAALQSKATNLPGKYPRVEGVGTAAVENVNAVKPLSVFKALPDMVRAIRRGGPRTPLTDYIEAAKTAFSNLGGHTPVKAGESGPPERGAPAKGPAQGDLLGNLPQGNLFGLPQTPTQPNLTNAPAIPFGAEGLLKPGGGSASGNAPINAVGQDVPAGITPQMRGGMENERMVVGAGDTSGRQFGKTERQLVTEEHPEMESAAGYRSFVVNKGGQVALTTGGPESITAGQTHVTVQPDGSYKVNSGPQLNKFQEGALRAKAKVGAPTPITKPAPNTVSQGHFDAIMDGIARAAQQRQSPDQPIPVKAAEFEHLTKAQKAKEEGEASTTQGVPTQGAPPEGQPPAGGASPISAVHYSDNPTLTELDPSRFGQNPHTSETQRAAAFPEQFQPTTFLGERGTYKEPAITSKANRYKAEIEKAGVYDIGNDPDNLVPTAVEAARKGGFFGNSAVISHLEQIIREKGYKGTIDSNGVLRMWDKVPVKYDPRKGVVFASTNTGEGMTLAESQKAVASQEHQDFMDKGKDSANSYGLDANVKPAIGSWTDGTEHSSRVEIEQPAGINQAEFREKVRATAAEMGKRGKQKFVTSFVEKEGGPDNLHSIEIPKGNKSIAEISNTLDQHGLANRTIHDKNGSTVVSLIDKGKQASAKVVAAAKALGATQIHTYEGHGDFDGADTREEAGRIYDNTISNASKWRSSAFREEQAAEGGNISWRAEAEGQGQGITLAQGRDFIVSKGGKVTAATGAPQSVGEGQTHVTVQPDGSYKVNSGPTLNKFQEGALKAKARSGTLGAGGRAKAQGQGGFAMMDIPQAIGEGARKLAEAFYSKAQQAAEDKLPNRIAGVSLIPTLRNAGVPESQLKWLGLDDFVAGKTMVDKKDVLDFIKQNDIKTKEITLGSSRPFTPVDQEHVDAISNWVKDHHGDMDDLHEEYQQWLEDNKLPADSGASDLYSASIYNRGRYKLTEPQEEYLRGIIDRFDKADTGVEIKRHAIQAALLGDMDSLNYLDTSSVPSRLLRPYHEAFSNEVPKVYVDRLKAWAKSKFTDEAEHADVSVDIREAALGNREAVGNLEMAGAPDDLLEMFRQNLDYQRAKYEDRPSLRTPGGANYRETLYSMPEKISPEAKRLLSIYPTQPSVNKFIEGHYSDIEPNVVAHSRSADFFTPDENGPSTANGTKGFKTLHTEEVQSDWNQRAREIREEGIERIATERGVEVPFGDERPSPEYQAILKEVPADYAYSSPKALKDAMQKAADLKAPWIAARQNVLDTVARHGGDDFNSYYDKSTISHAELVHDRFLEEAGDAGNAASRQDLIEKANDINRALNEFNKIDKEVEETNDTVDKLKKSRLPDNPFKTNWHEFVMKSLLRKAAEGGYDRLSWTTGQMQNDRYNLAQVVDDLTYDPQNGMLIGSKDGHRVYSENVEATQRKLQRHIGKEPAAKLMRKIQEYNDDKFDTAQWDIVESGKHMPPSGAHPQGLPIFHIIDPNGEIHGDANGPYEHGSRYQAQRALENMAEEEDAKIPSPKITGQDLQVGGTGMKGFYDKMLVDFMNKYGKKWGARVGMSNLPQSHDASLNDRFESSGRAYRIFDGGGEVYGVAHGHETLITDRNEIKDYTEYVMGDKQPGVPVHHIDITPEMKKDILYKGQPISKSLPASIPPKIRQMMEGASA